MGTRRAGAVVAALVVAAAGCGGPTQPIDVGTDFATAVCEGNFQDAAELASTELYGGRTITHFGDEMRFRSPCDGEVVETESQADIGMESTTVRTRLEHADGAVTLHELDLAETEEGWRVADIAPYEGDWPPNAG